MIIGIIIGVLIVVVVVIGFIRARRRKKQYDLETLAASKRMQDELAAERNEFSSRNPDVQKEMNYRMNPPRNNLF